MFEKKEPESRIVITNIQYLILFNRLYNFSIDELKLEMIRIKIFYLFELIDNDYWLGSNKLYICDHHAFQSIDLLLTIR